MDNSVCYMYIISSLIIVLVPCYLRCNQMALIPTNEKLLMIEGDDEAWVDTHHNIGICRSHDITSSVT